MGTRAATFNAKIKNLQEYHLRILHGISLPTEMDIGCTLKYFSQTLMGVLKDVPEAPLEMLRRRSQDAMRLALFPILDYCGLFRVLTQLLDIVSLLPAGVDAFGRALLHAISCLVPFIEHALIDTLPYTVAASLATFPAHLHSDIVQTLCHYLLPFTLDPDVENDTSAAIPAIIMMAVQHTQSVALQCQLLETVMSRRRMVVRDLFSVIGHGTVAARTAAVQLLFHYWPTLCPGSGGGGGCGGGVTAATSITTTADQRAQCLHFNGLDIKTIGWEPHQCERDNCRSAGDNEAFELCLNHNVAVLQGSEYPPPLYVCKQCSEDIRSSDSQISMFEILLPMQHVSNTCENKNCRSSEKLAVCTCFHIECAAYNGNRPIRYCLQCDQIRHSSRRGLDHVVQRRIESLWQCAPDVARYMVDAVVSLLKEAQPLSDSRRNREQNRHTRAGLLDDEEQIEGEPSLEQRRSLSRYGVWLLVDRCSLPSPAASSSTSAADGPHTDTLARLLAALFNWFETTAYVGDDQAGNVLELLKSEYVHGWLRRVLNEHFDVIASCLMPRPPEYARVGGHWDSLVSKTQHIVDGFHRLFCLVPYEIISGPLWNLIMPNWLEAIRQDVADEEMPELRIILSKLLDPVMSPLGFDSDMIYQFVSVRFLSSKPRVQQQALTWLQILSTLDIAIPLPNMHKMFRNGVRCLCSWREPAVARKTSVAKSHAAADLGPVMESESRSASPLSADDGDFSTDQLSAAAAADSGGGLGSAEQRQHTPASTTHTTDMIVPCFVLMLDTLLKQMDIQEIPRHQGLPMNVSQQALMLLKSMLSSPTEGRHTCDTEHSASLSQDNQRSSSCKETDDTSLVQQCDACTALLQLYQLAALILTYICPANEEIHTVEVNLDDSDDELQSGLVCSLSEHNWQQGGSQPSSATHTGHSADGGPASLTTIDTSSARHQVAAPVTISLDVVRNLPSEHVIPARATAVTIAQDELACSQASVSARPTVVGGSAGGGATVTAAVDNTFWTTSHGRFRFTIDELPPELQLLYGLLNRLRECDDQDVIAQMMYCLRLLVLHAECLRRAARDQRGFLVWCQENLIIKQLWDVLRSEHSQIAEEAVPVLLHAITLPYGAEVFWHIVEREFHDDDWKVRFAAVERATVLARFVSVERWRQSGVAAVLAPLAHVFVYLVRSVDDMAAVVAQKAAIYLDTIPSNGIRTICESLEWQFDTVIGDRPLVLNTLLRLFNQLPAADILTWEFFNNRFETLLIETQLDMEACGELTVSKDLKLFECDAEMYQARVARAREALCGVWLQDTAPTCSGAGITASSSAAGRRILTASVGARPPYQRCLSAGASHTVSARLQHIEVMKHNYLRQTSAPILKRKMSKFTPGQTSQTTSDATHCMSSTLVTAAAAAGGIAGGVVGGVVGGGVGGGAGGGSVLPLLYRHMCGGDGADAETLFLLAELLMSFLARAEQVVVADDKQSLKIQQQQQQTLKHISMCVGLNCSDKVFFMSPQRLRSSAPFNAILSRLAGVLDYNLSVGPLLLPLMMPLLVYAAAPSRQHADTCADGRRSFTLWHLERQQRYDWLMAVITTVYKHELTDTPLSDTVLSVCRVVINTLSAQLHVCRPVVGACEHQPATLSCSTPHNAPASLSVTVNTASVGKCGVDVCSGGALSAHTGDKHNDSAEFASSACLSGGAGADGVAASSAAHGLSLTSAGSRGSHALNEDDEDAGASECQLEVILESPRTLSSSHSRAESVVVETATTAGYPLDDMSSVQLRMTSVNTGTTTSRSVSDGHTEGSTGSRAPAATTRTDGVSVAGGVINTVGGAAGNVVEGATSTSTAAPQSDDVRHKARNVPSRRRGFTGVPPLEHSMSVDVFGGGGVSGAVGPILPPGASRSPQRTRSVALPPPDERHRLTAPSSSSADKSLFEYISHAFSRQESQGADCGSTARLLSSIHLGLSAVAAADLCVVRDSTTTTTTTTTAAAAAAATTTSDINNTSSSDSSSSSDVSDGDLDESRSLGSRLKLAPSGGRTTNDFTTSALGSSATAKRRVGHEMLQKGRRRRHNRNNNQQRSQSHMPPAELRPSQRRVGDDCVTERCVDCGQTREHYSEEEMALCVLVLSTLVHREPALAAVLLPDILRITATVSVQQRYPWQGESSYHLPGSVNSVSRQLLRCVLHKLHVYNVALKLFQMDMDVNTTHVFFRTVAQSLLDFAEYNAAALLLSLFETLNQQSVCPSADQLGAVFYNMSVYMEQLPLETTSGSAYTQLFPPLEQLLRRLTLGGQLVALDEPHSLVSVMTAVLKISTVAMHKSILEPFSKALSLVIQHWRLNYQRLSELCQQCQRAFVKERDRHQLARVAVFELVQALKFKVILPESNLLLLISFLVQDAGGAVPACVASLIAAGEYGASTAANAAGATGAADCMRPHLADALDFLADVHTVAHLRHQVSSGVGCGAGAVGVGMTGGGGGGGDAAAATTAHSADTIGASVKTILAQFVALEMSRVGGRDASRPLARYLPWLFSTPSSVQQGPKEFIECVGHIRLLSWLLLGSMTHINTLGRHSNVWCQPVSAEASCHIADHVQVIVAGFAEQSKASVLHMSSLFHAFILCQLWTVYLELLAEPPCGGGGGGGGGSGDSSTAMAVIADFWAKVTPGLLQLISHSRVLADMVNLHFLSLLEGLSECSSSTLVRLLPIWRHLFQAANIKLPSHLRVRLQNCQQQPVLEPCCRGGSGGGGGLVSGAVSDASSGRLRLAGWLQRLQFKLAQVELQSSAATQFYTV